MLPAISRSPCLRVRCPLPSPSNPLRARCRRRCRVLHAEVVVADQVQHEMYKGFDIILDHIPRLSHPSTTPHAPWAILYLVAVLTKR